MLAAFGAIGGASPRRSAARADAQRSDRHLAQRRAATPAAPTSSSASTATITLKHFTLIEARQDRRRPDRRDARHAGRRRVRRRRARRHHAHPLFAVHEDRPSASCSRSTPRTPTTSRRRTAKCASASTAPARSSQPWQVEGAARDGEAEPEPPQPNATSKSSRSAGPPSRSPKPRSPPSGSRAVAPATQPQAPCRPAESSSQQSQEPRITVNWENAPITDVLGVFAAFTGRTILPSKNVTGNGHGEHHRTCRGTSRSRKS